MRTVALLGLMSGVMTGLVVGGLVVAGVLRSPLETAEVLGRPAGGPTPVPTASSAPLPPAPRKGEVVALPTLQSAGRPAPQLPAGSPLEPAKALYEQNCASCHGNAGDKIANVSLATVEFLDRRGEAILVRSMSRGKGIMPAFASDKGGSLTPEEIKHLHDYIRFLAGARADRTLAGTALPPTPAPPVIAAAGPRPGGPVPPDEIPHGVNGWEEKCLDCHGKDGFAPVQVSHAGRAVRTCLYCHVLKSGVQEVDVAATRATTGSTEAPRIPHAVVQVGPACGACHSESGYKPVTPAHSLYAPTPCYECHDPGVPLNESGPVSATNR